MLKVPSFLLLFLVVCCNEKGRGNHLAPTQDIIRSFETIAAIPVPAGYKRITSAQESFADWLRKLRLKKDNQLHLYNGSLKQDQSSHYAVLDMPIGKKDLQQCADAVMRLRADYLFHCKRYTEIVFRDNNNKAYQWTKGDDRKEFDAYLEKVFAMCGTASLEKQLTIVSPEEAMPGDVFIKGGFPGHAMMIADMAINEKGEKIFMLLQGYMPAQDIHIVKNLMDERISPWYNANDKLFITPGWSFRKEELRRWSQGHDRPPPTSP